MDNYVIQPMTLLGATEWYVVDTNTDDIILGPYDNDYYASVALVEWLKGKAL